MRIHYQFFARILDTLNIATCLYDEADKAVLWNRAFFRFFPEHEDCIYDGEPYRENLLRFYRGRLADDELGDIDRYVNEGIARHRQQTRPYTFEHRGLWLRVSSLRMHSIGRLRIWIQVPPPKIGLTSLFYAPAEIAPSDDHSDAALLESMADGITVIDHDGLIQSVNIQFLLLYGFASRESVLGHSMIELYQLLWHTAEGGATSTEEIRQQALALEENLRFTGAPFELSLSGNRWMRVIAERNQAGVSYCIHTDITEIKQRQQELERAERRARESEARYRLLADHQTDVVVGLDAQQRVRYVSPSITLMLGVDPIDLMEKAWSEVMISNAGERFSGWDKSMKNSRDARYTFRVQHQNGTSLWIEKNISVLPHQGDFQAIEFIFHLRDVTARKTAEEALERANAELAAQALTDGLTGLANRRHFDLTIAREWQRMRREKESLTLLMIDIDYFKKLNDQYGHQVGDECLKRLATEIRKAARRPGDLAARYGGEEFVLLLPHTELQDAMRIAEQLLQSVRELPVQPYDISSGFLAASIGVASIRPEKLSKDVAHLLRMADIALYKAKHNGRNRCEQAEY